MKSPESFSGVAIVPYLVLLPAGARTASGTGDPVTLEGFSTLFLQLDVTAAATAAGDTLDVFVQTTVDLENWTDAYHFTQVLGNGGAKRFLAKVNAYEALTEFENGSALAEANGRALFGDQWRVRWAIAEADDASFTFSVKANGLG